MDGARGVRVACILQHDHSERQVIDEESDA